MKGTADWLAFVVLGLCFMLLVGILPDTCRVAEEIVGGDILAVNESRNFFGYTDFTITLDLDNGSVVICPVRSDMLGGTLYRLYRNRKPELPRLRETARVQVGRHSGSVVCRGLAMANAEQRTGD